MPKAKKEPVKGHNIFECQLCADRPQIDGSTPGAFSAHLTDVHQMDAKAKYRKEVNNHLDARDWYEWNYSWYDGETLFALQSIRQPRQDKGYW